MSEINENLKKQGFKYGKSGAHAARSMMINELKLLFEATDISASYQDYKQAIINQNVLQKATQNSRKITLRHLKDLYGLSPEIIIFNTFRQWWDVSEDSQPVLALQLAVARDPLLRGSVDTILQHSLGEIITRNDIEAYLASDDPDRFSPASLTSFARNINGTWTQAGYLIGKSKKTRTQAKVSFVNTAFALFLAQCQDLSGQRMFNSQWCKLLDQEQEALYHLAYTASLKGLLSFKHASDVIEVTFPKSLFTQASR